MRGWYERHVGLVLIGMSALSGLVMVLLVEWFAS